MGISTQAALIASFRNPTERRFFAKGNIGTTAAGVWNSLFIVAGEPEIGVAPTTSVICDRTTIGALNQQNGGSGVLRILSARWTAGGNSSAGPAPVVGLLYDRLVHSGGLSGTSIATQTTNLPTAALTRYTSGVGVQIALEIYTAVGTTATTATLSYTNQAGTAGQTTDITFGGTNFNTNQRFIQVPLAAGDTGVKSVESVTLAASTLTAGNFGVVLYKPLIPLVAARIETFPEISFFHYLGGFIPEIVDDAALCILGTSLVSTIGPFSAVFNFSED